MRGLGCVGLKLGCMMRARMCRYILGESLG